jgi:hypothetical protein
MRGNIYSPVQKNEPKSVPQESPESQGHLYHGTGADQ